jgi:hypothetical protein
LASLLLGVRPSDRAAIGDVALLMARSRWLCCLAARIAIRVDPMILLREEWAIR